MEVSKMGLFGKSKKELERENQLLKDMLVKQAVQKKTTPKAKKIMYQCRYCGYKSIRNATEGVPLPGTNNCPRHPKGTHKGPHSWIRTYL